LHLRDDCRCRRLLAAPQGLSAPTLQSSLNYLLLAVVYLGLHVRKQGWRLKAQWWAYAILAFLDVEGNFLLVMAYRYTSLTSVTLLDSFTIPMVVCLSAGLLGAIYRRGHYLGFSLCLGGLLVLVVTDRSTAGSGGGGQQQEASNPLLGDALVLLGATLYALCNVLQEWLLGEGWATAASLQTACCSAWHTLAVWHTLCTLPRSHTLHHTLLAASLLGCR
jgi:solute carrier family 35 protein F1/2